ncbi:MAG: M23 family metallopeptidase [Candidatus Kerfeldbacteria bacterium]|nr:M23 family metallopeptidase [Candidatus Kerfeldbacteria bacterium]
MAANDNTPATNATTPPRGYNAAPISDFVPPIDNFAARITKKPFGIYITPATSPVQPERFQGYHTGDDAETTADEQYKDVPIVSMADGEVILARYVSGYGGVMMIVSTIKGQTVTALYGHLRLSSLTKKVGNNAKKGEKIGVLGTGYTSETDGERKHLHFGILKGRSTNVKGYVSSKAALTDWNDPLAWLKEQGAL